MKIRKTLAVTAAILTLGVPVATAAQNGYQPDVIDRYLANTARTAFSRSSTPSTSRMRSSAMSPIAEAGSLPDPTGASVPVDSPEGPVGRPAVSACSSAPRSFSSRSPARRAARAARTALAPRNRVITRKGIDNEEPSVCAEGHWASGAPACGLRQCRSGRQPSVGSLRRFLLGSPTTRRRRRWGGS